MIEHLLRQRFRRRPSDGDTDERALLDVALAISGEATPEELDRATEHMQDPDIARAVLLAREEEQTEVRELRPRWRRAARYVPHAVAASLVAVLTWVLLPELDQPTELALKGGDTIAVAVQRGERRFVAREGEVLENGDQLGLFYSTSEDGYLAVIAVDAAGAAAWVFPAHAQQSGAITAGEKVPVPDGLLVQEGSGCEWVVAAFSEQPLARPDVLATVSAAARRTTDCTLKVSIPGARTVRVFGVRR